MRRPTGGTKRKREGGWSQREGGWRNNPAPDAFVIKSPYPLIKLLGEGLFNRLKQDALENYAISLVKCRGRDSTAGRELSRKQGTTTNQLTIIGGDCGFVFKLFRKAALDAGGKALHRALAKEWGHSCTRSGTDRERWHLAL